MAKTPKANIRVSSFAGETTGAIIVREGIEWEDAAGAPHTGMVTYVFTAKCNGLTGTIGNLRATWALGSNLQTKRSAIRARLNAELAGTELGVSLSEAAIEADGIPT